MAHRVSMVKEKIAFFPFLHLAWSAVTTSIWITPMAQRNRGTGIYLLFDQKLGIWIICNVGFLKLYLPFSLFSCRESGGRMWFKNSSPRNSSDLGWVSKQFMRGNQETLVSWVSGAESMACSVSFDWCVGSGLTGLSSFPAAPYLDKRKRKQFHLYFLCWYVQKPKIFMVFFILAICWELKELTFSWQKP